MTLLLSSCTCYCFCCDYLITAVSCDAESAPAGAGLSTDNCWAVAHRLISWLKIIVPILIEYFFLSFDKGNMVLLELRALHLVVHRAFSFNLSSLQQC